MCEIVKKAEEWNFSKWEISTGLVFKIDAIDGKKWVRFAAT